MLYICEGTARRRRMMSASWVKINGGVDITINNESSILSHVAGELLFFNHTVPKNRIHFG